MKHVIRTEDDRAAHELGSQTHSEPRERTSDASDSQGATLSPLAGSQPMAAETGSAASDTQSAHANRRTEDTLRAVATCLDRVAAAYIDSIQSRISRAR